MTGTTIHQYEILEKLGAGGQGTVYKALDKKLNRRAVIKILPPELTARTANFKRFEREAQLCSQLDHPNICTIYDYHEENGVYYIAMQFLEGKTVRQLVDGRPLELRSAINIAIQVCDALAYAHSKNIIHRDIKAGNVMVTDKGMVKILDFGLAKLVQDEPEILPANVDRADLTELGIPYGTATYAAPEQAKGEKTDHRADIFSTGVLLYELLTGIWAFQGKTVIDVRHEVLHGTPTPLSQMRHDNFPPRLQDIIDKALAKAPKDRYQNIEVMKTDLQNVLIEISGMPVLENQLVSPKHLEGGGVVKRAWDWLTGKSTSVDNYQLTPTSSSSSISNPPTYSPDTTLTQGGIEKKTVAILPFKNLSGNDSVSFYEFALADAVITELAQLRSLIVRPSSVIAKYQGKEFDPRNVGRELRVHAVLSASFISSGERLRVTAQLLDVMSGEILWSDRIDAESGDILVLQDTIAQRILDGLELKLSDKEQERLNRRPTENAEAYEEYLRGRDNFARFVFRTVKNEDCEAAIKNFKHAVELDSQFALAHSALGACYANRAFKGMGEKDDYTHAEAAFSKAFKYDPEVVEARVLMVMVYMARGEKTKARAEIKLLQEQFPNDAPLYFVKGVMNRLDGDYDESLESFAKLARLDPMAKAVAAYNRSRIYTYRGQFEQAFEELDKGEEAEPNHPLIKVFRATALFHSGKEAEGLKLIQSVIEENPKMAGIRPIIAKMLAYLDKDDEAREQLTEEALALSKADHDMAYWVASAYALLDEKEKAFKWLERAVKLGNENVPLFRNDKMLESLREDPRFEQTIGKISHQEVV